MFDTRKSAASLDEQTSEPADESQNDAIALGPSTQNKEVGQKGGEAVQKKQEEESYQEYEEESQDEKKQKKISDYDLWGED